MNQSIDPRILQLSYSYRTLLHGCPRKYQLTKIATRYRERSSSVTFAFGHAVGMGIQSSLEGKSWNNIVLDMFLAWDYVDILGEEPVAKKSFAHAVFAVMKFQSVKDSYIKDYELATFQGKPAVELSFRIQLIDGFNYTGHVDVVLRHKITGHYMVLEVKTTGSSTVAEAQYKNSSQAIGYSIILDVIAPGQSSYDVLYLVYCTKSQEFQVLPFTKSYSERAKWIQDLMMDIDIVRLYEKAENYPTHGEYCYSFFRECEFFSNCKLGTEYLAVPYDAAEPVDRISGESEFTLELSLLDLIDAQLNRQEI
jgi:hypothetical protein